jgi:hypothetical protein
MCGNSVAKEAAGLPASVLGFIHSFAAPRTTRKRVWLIPREFGAKRAWSDSCSEYPTLLSPSIGPLIASDIYIGRANRF